MLMHDCMLRTVRSRPHVSAALCPHQKTALRCQGHHIPNCPSSAAQTRGGGGVGCRQQNGINALGAKYEIGVGMDVQWRNGRRSVPRGNRRLCLVSNKEHAATSWSAGP